MSNKEIKELSNALGGLGSIVRGADKVEIYELNETTTLYIVDGKPAIARLLVKWDSSQGEYVIPLLTYVYTNPGQIPNYPAVVVDDGAVPHIVNGADVMRPGIKEVSGSFGAGDLVAIKDLKGRVIAFGVSLVSSGELTGISRGKVIKVIHHIGDKLWNLARELERK